MHACRRLVARLVDAALCVAAVVSASAQLARDHARPLVAVPLQAPAAAASWVKSFLVAPAGEAHTTLEE